MHARLALVVVAALSTRASADAPKYKRVQHVPPPPPPAASQARAPAPPAAAQPTVTSDQVLAGIEQAQPVRRKQEAILLKLIVDTPDTDPDKPDYLFRLAEHYAMQQRFWRLEANAPQPK